MILYQLWRFVTPGLTRSERRLIWPMLIGSIILFAIGISIGYFVIPYALEFLLGLSLPGVETQLRLSEYVSFVSTVMLAFGLAFQFPVLLLVLARVRDPQLQIPLRAASLGGPAHRAVRDHHHAGRRPAELLGAVARDVRAVRGHAPDHSHHGQVSVWLFTDARMDAHAQPGHPESPDRRRAAASGVRSAAGDALVEPPVELIDAVTLAAIHDPRHVALLDEAAAQGGGWADADTYLAQGSMTAARLAAGATLQAALAVASGAATVAFAVVRPPGHHAGRSAISGFCVLNNIAIAVAGLRRRGLAQRIAVIDWDVHHGDGTQAIFDDDPDLCYASTHQSPFYPGTGARSESGIGPGRGTKHNRPLPAGSGDEAFIDAWTDLLAEIEDFRPEAILVSAGYDAHVDDPLAELAVTEAGFETVARLVGSLAARTESARRRAHAGGRIRPRGARGLRCSVSEGSARRPGHRSGACLSTGYTREPIGTRRGQWRARHPSTTDPRWTRRARRSPTR